MSRYSRLSIDQHTELGELLTTASDHLYGAARVLAPVSPLNDRSLIKIRQVIGELVEIGSKLEQRLFVEHDGYPVTIYFGPREFHREDE